jgi:hypothetical protein
MAVVETIPDALKAETEASLAWLNAERGAALKITGVVDPDHTIAARERGDTYELGLVLCQDELCIREQIAVRRLADGFDLALVEAPPVGGRSDGKLDPPPELDPAPGTRKGWLDERLAEHRFSVILFYRGFW